MASEKRVYLVIDADGNERLVKANSQAQAVRHVAMGRYTVKAASAAEVCDFFVSGGKMEEAGVEPEDSETAGETAEA